MRSGKIIPAFVCAGISIAVTAPARGDTRGDVLAGVQRCGVIHDDRTWLDCVYGAQQPMRGQLGLPPAPEFQQRLVPPAGVMAQPSMAPQAMAHAAVPMRQAVRPLPRKKPGFFATLVGAAPPTAVSRMASYRYDKSGAFIVTLENGQQWRQTDVVGGTVTWTRQPSSYLVTITPGAFGSYSMHTDENPRNYKVEPVK
jgi:hypothetical protein